MNSKAVETCLKTAVILAGLTLTVCKIRTEWRKGNPSAKECKGQWIFGHAHRSPCAQCDA
jgi:hypothetical protein